MRIENIVDDYLKRIDSELFGLDPKARKTALDEIRAHIKDRTMDAAKDRGLDRPDERTVREALKDFGNPFEVAGEYRKDMKIKTPLTIKAILSYCIFIAVLDILIMAFYFRDAYWEAIWQYTDHGYFWGALSIGAVYGVLGITLGTLSIMQLRSTTKISYLGHLTLIISVFSIVAAILGGILQQVIEWELGYDLWSYPNNLVVGAISIVPILAFLVFPPLFDRFRRILEVKEEDPGRIIRYRKRGQTLALSTGIVFLILIGLLSIGLFDHDMNREDRTFEQNELLETIHVRPGVRIEVWNGHGPYMDTAYKIIYKENGEEVTHFFNPSIQGAAQWLLNNSNPGEVVFAWWDLGYSIEGYTGLDVVIDKPSRYIEQTLWDPSSVEEWEEDEIRLRDVSLGLITTDPSVTLNLMGQNNATYLLTTARQQYSILYALILGAGKDPSEYINWETNTLTDLGKSTVIHRIWKGEGIPGLELVYSDLEVKVLKRV
ncbi:MAG: hypothetical protein QCI82_03810 [Candidatus Thermoplasmatota archaeon]|nr:hypothetical protein [Candidatus Thermoplasmatota archaeon]